MANNKAKEVIQVCAEIHADNQDRELNGLNEAMRFFKLKKGVIVTLNQKDTLKTEAGTVELIPYRDFIGQ